MKLFAQTVLWTLMVLALGFAAMLLFPPAFAATSPPDGPIIVACPYGTWGALEVALEAEGLDYVHIDFLTEFGVRFEDYRSMVLVHQRGGLAAGFELNNGCMSEPLNIAPEVTPV